MTDDRRMGLMWEYFAEGLGGDRGKCEGLHIDWWTHGMICGLRFATDNQEVWELSNWLFDFDAHRISLEG